ncbi:hypothetical protein E2C01_016695 [Portunus trituberculatus]|uniref:Uncharacterized protein n=1 Tax=Portunus trituberculatus TaxID=210409 RepID=A0A5B7DR80_PORTR|nr:hypothetical protein [Portunus trituberculatus]
MTRLRGAEQRTEREKFAMHIQDVLLRRPRRTPSRPRKGRPKHQAVAQAQSSVNTQRIHITFLVPISL